MNFIISMNNTDVSLQRYFPWLLLIGILLNVPGLWLPIIEPDGALYATIAKRMALHNDWLNLYAHGADWLDKPHFPFWLAAASYKVFGINSFAYKLPAFAFWLISIYYTYLTARDLFNKSVAGVAVLLYTVALHSTLANFDVRAEPFLSACVAGAIWHMLRVYQGRDWWHIVMAALLAGCAMMTKGIFVLITIGGGWVLFWVFTNQWKQFIDLRWWLFLLLSFVFILPELYSLYIQFDMHPEKLVFGERNVSGLKFFFWDSQFGRFFNTGPIKGKGDITFFIHTSLWAFLPWSLGLVGGVVYLARFDKEKNPLRWVIYGSTLITFLMFSLSRFQLPHYIVMIFPYYSIITAYFFYQLALGGKLRSLAISQKMILVLLAAAVCGLLYWTDMQNAPLATGITAFVLFSGLLIRANDSLQKLLYAGYAAAVMLYIFLFVFFYPFLFQYQSGSELAKLIPSEKRDLPMATYKSFSPSFEFYAPGEVQVLKSEIQLSDFMAQGPCLVYTSDVLGDSLIKAGVKAEVTQAPYFHITMLKGKFLNHQTRSSALQKRYLLYIKK
jgi:4-amino-4-deoxy-L-arabinose transferase-like glycosyltransferase